MPSFYQLFFMELKRGPTHNNWIRSLDAFDQWCLHHTLRVPWWAHVCSEGGYQHTKQLPLTHTSIICTRCLKLLGHNVQVSPSVAHN